MLNDEELAVRDKVADFVDPTLPVLEPVYSHHTNPQQAGEIFTQVQPAMAAYSHIVIGAPPMIPDLPLLPLVDLLAEAYVAKLTAANDNFAPNGDLSR